MEFGLSLAAFTIVHVLISLAAIGSGIVVVAGMLRAERLGGWTAIFLALTTFRRSRATEGMDIDRIENVTGWETTSWRRGALMAYGWRWSG